MKKRIAMFLAAAMAAMYAQADTWKDPNTGYTWTYRINGDTAEIYNGGNVAVSPNPTGAVTIPSTLGGKPVTSIGSDAFFDCRGLTSVTIPNSVTSIGFEAFYGCSGLMSIEVGSGNANYSSANGLLLSKNGKTLIRGVNGDVTIPDSVTSIGYDAFSRCSGLTSVTIPNSVTSIGSQAFYNCTNVTDVVVPGWACEIPFGAVTNLVISEGTTRIRDFAFSGCSGLMIVTIPNSVTSIGYDAFRGC